MPNFTNTVFAMRIYPAKHILVLLVSILCMIAFLPPSEQALGQTAKLTVQVDRPGPKVSPTLYGIFFEEINCAVMVQQLFTT